MLAGIRSFTSPASGRSRSIRCLQTLYFLIDLRFFTRRQHNGSDGALDPPNRDSNGCENQQQQNK